MNTVNSQYRHRLQDNEHLIFIHIPKTAGTSLRLLISRNFPREEVLGPFPSHTTLFDDAADPDKDFAPYRLLTGHFYYPDKLFTTHTATYITMLRDPVERALSLYGFARQQPASNAHRLATSHSINEFMRHPDAQRFIANMMTRRLGTPGGWMTLEQVHLDRALARLDAMPFVGIVEFFEASLHLMNYVFGWEPATHLQKANVTRDRPTLDMLTPDTLHYLREANQFDLALYAHGMQHFQERLNGMVRELVTNRG